MNSSTDLRILPLLELSEGDLKLREVDLKDQSNLSDSLEPTEIDLASSEMPDPGWVAEEKEEDEDNQHSVQESCLSYEWSTKIRPFFLSLSPSTPESAYHPIRTMVSELLFLLTERQQSLIFFFFLILPLLLLY